MAWSFEVTQRRWITVFMYAMIRGQHGGVMTLIRWVLGPCRRLSWQATGCNLQINLYFNSSPFTFGVDDKSDTVPGVSSTAFEDTGTKQDLS